MKLKQFLTGTGIAFVASVGALNANAGLVFPDEITVGYGEGVGEAAWFVNNPTVAPDSNSLTLTVLGTPTAVDFSFESCDLTVAGENLPGCDVTDGIQNIPTVTALLSNTDGIVWTDTWEIPFNGGLYELSLAGLSGEYTLAFATQADGGLVDIDIAAVPIPAAAILFGTALAGFAGFSARRKA